MQDLESWRSVKVRDILGSDENELTVAHALSNLDELIDDLLSTHWIKKNIEFVHYSEGSFQGFTESQQKRNSSTQRRAYMRHFLYLHAHKAQTQ